MNQGIERKGSGRTTVLSPEEEKQLKSCIEMLCQVGFSPTRNQLLSLVKDYVENNNVKNPFLDNKPGFDWLKGFMERNKLSMQKANMISAARMAATSNPFIVYDFFDVVGNIIEEKNLTAEKIWNCDESGFPTDPKKCKVVSIKGKTAYKVTCGAGRENITTLAVCNAAGRALDPLIIFQGKNLQTTWRGKDVLPNTF